MVAVKIVAALVIAYIIGGTPMGVIIGRLFYRTDIRRHGSGNIGMTNAYRILGPFGGVVVLIADIAKGVFAVAVPKYLFFPGQFPAESLLTTLAVAGCAFAAVFGASYSVFLKLSGGKSVGAAAGAILFLFPWTILILLPVWIVVVSATKYMSVASIVIATMFPFTVALLYPGYPEAVAIAAVIGALVIYRHRSNIARLLEGTERKFHLVPRREE